MAQDLLELGNMDVLFLAGAYNSGHSQEDGATSSTSKANAKTKVKGAKSKAKALKQSELLAASSSSSSDSGASTGANASTPVTPEMLQASKARDQVEKSVAAAVAAAKSAAAAAAPPSGGSAAPAVEKEETGVNGLKTAEAGGEDNEGAEELHLAEIGAPKEKLAPQADTVVVVR